MEFTESSPRLIVFDPPVPLEDDQLITSMKKLESIQYRAALAITAASLETPWFTTPLQGMS